MEHRITELVPVLSHMGYEERFIVIHLPTLGRSRQPGDLTETLDKYYMMGLVTWTKSTFFKIRESNKTKHLKTRESWILEDTNQGTQSQYWSS